MSPLWIAVLLAASIAAVVWWTRRRAIARRHACRHELAALLAAERPELSLVRAEPGRWRLRRDADELATIDGRALTTGLPGHQDARRRRYLAVADAAAMGPRPFAGDFDLKRHGIRILPRLADEGLPLLLLGADAARHIPTDCPDLTTIYLVEGESRGAYLTDEHLHQAGIDGRDVHGVSLAVLRQRFDEGAIRAALTGERVEIIKPDDGCGGSRLLLLSEALNAGESLFATAPAPDLLLVAADRGRLETALEEIDEPVQPLPRTVFRVTTDGLRLES